MPPLPTDAAIEADAASQAAATLARLSSLHPRNVDLSLERIHAVLEDLGAPHRRLPPVVHVAGTNGKGSTIACMRAGLEAAGRRVHVYTSPHLVRFNERIRLAGQLIGDSYLQHCLARCEQANAGRPLTFFEATTAAAFLAFADVPADVLLLETGLGGRLDATNVLDRPALTMITTLALDHQDYLGDDLAGIAREKAGIMRPEVPCIVAPQEPDLMPVLRAAAQAVGCPLVEFGRDWSVSDAGELTWHDGQRHLRLPRPLLAGPHQIVNAGLALTGLNRLPGMAPDDAAMARALATTQWPARLQRLTDGPLPALLPDGAELWLDGGHNPSAATMLARTLAAMPPRPLTLILGMLSNRDPAAYLRPFAELSPRVLTVTVQGEQAAHPAEAMAQRIGAGARAAGDVSSALSAVDGSAPRVLICGSLYLAGEVLRLNGMAPD